MKVLIVKKKKNNKQKYPQENFWIIKEENEDSIALLEMIKIK